MPTPLNTNALYNEIQSKQEGVNSQTDAIKQLYAGQPTFQDNMQQGLVGNDNTLNSALGNYTDSVAELFAHDKQISANWGSSTAPTQAPSFAPEGYVENPYERAKSSADLYATKGKEMAANLKTYEGRKNMLGDIVDKAMLVYQAGIKGKEMDYQKAANELATTMDLFKMANSNEQADKDRANALKISNSKSGGNGATGVDEIDNANDKTIQQAFVKKFGNKAWNNLGAVTQRATSARTILAQVITGDKLNVKDLMNPTEAKAWDIQDQLSNDISMAIGAFTGKKGAFGTGPLAGLQPSTGVLSVLTPQRTKDLRNAMSEINTAKVKEISGVAVSDREYERLVNLLPDFYQLETENLRRLNLMKSRIEANKELLYLAKINNLTNSDVVKKYGSEIWTKYGLMPDGDNPKKSDISSNNKTEADEIIGSTTVKVGKYTVNY